MSINPHQQPAKGAALLQLEKLECRAGIAPASGVDPKLGQPEHPRQQRLGDVDRLDAFERDAAGVVPDQAGLDAHLAGVDDIAGAPPDPVADRDADGRAADQGDEGARPQRHVAPPFAVGQRGKQTGSCATSEDDTLDDSGERVCPLGGRLRGRRHGQA